MPCLHPDPHIHPTLIFQMLWGLNDIKPLGICVQFLRCVKHLINGAVSLGKRTVGLECSPIGEGLSSISKALGSILSIKKTRCP